MISRMALGRATHPWITKPRLFMIGTTIIPAALGRTKIRRIRQQ